MGRWLVVIIEGVGVGAVSALLCWVGVVLIEAGCKKASTWAGRAIALAIGLFLIFGTISFFIHYLRKAKEYLRGK